MFVLAALVLAVAMLAVPVALLIQAYIEQRNSRWVDVHVETLALPIADPTNEILDPVREAFEWAVLVQQGRQS